MHHAHVGVLGGQPVQALRALVGRAVVDEDQLQPVRRHALPQERVDARLEVLAGVVDRDDDAHADRHGRSLQRRWVQAFSRHGSRRPLARPRFPPGRPGQGRGAGVGGSRAARPRGSPRARVPSAQRAGGARAAGWIVLPLITCTSSYAGLPWIRLR